MSSPGQKRGGCGHQMASFDGHAYCARCRDKKKGEDPCVKSPDSECSFCAILTPEQLLQLSTPSYRLKKEKREARKMDATPSKDSSLVEPSSVSVIGPVGTSSSSAPAIPEKKPKKDKPSTASSSTVKAKKSTKSVEDSKYLELDKKWTDRFNRLEALLLAKSLQPADQPAFSASVIVPPAHSPPAAISKDSEPFFQPLSSGRTGTDSSVLVHQSASQPGSDKSSSERTGKDISASQHLSSSQLVTDQQPVRQISPGRTGKDSSASRHQSASQPSTDRQRPVTHTGTDPSSIRPSSDSKARSDRPRSLATDSGSPTLHRRRRNSSSSGSSASDSDFTDRPPVDLYAEEGELSEDQDCTTHEPDQAISEEQTYRETMSGIRSYMGWSNIPELDSTATGSDDNPFSGPKSSTPGKVSVNMPTEDWLCKKISKLNVTLVEGYPSRSSEAGGLLMDQFLRPAKSQSKWYGLSSDHKADPSAVSSWYTDACKLNSTYSRIARQSGLTTSHPTSRRISQETLRRWEKSAREATIICNQAASFNRCLFKVQQDIQEQFKTVRSENKGKSSTKVSAAMDEMQHLMYFNSSICQAAAKTMEHLTEFVFVSMGNLTLARRDAYLTHLRTGVKPDTLAGLRTAPIHINTLFPDSLIKKAEEEIVQYESKGQSSSSKGKGRYHPYERPERKGDKKSSSFKSYKPSWKNIGKGHQRRNRGKSSHYSSRPAKGQQSFK